MERGWVSAPPWSGAGWVTADQGGSLGGNVESIAWQGGVMAFSLGYDGSGPWGKSWKPNVGWSGWARF